MKWDLASTRCARPSCAATARMRMCKPVWEGWGDVGLTRPTRWDGALPPGAGGLSSALPCSTAPCARCRRRSRAARTTARSRWGRCFTTAWRSARRTAPGACSPTCGSAGCGRAPSVTPASPRSLCGATFSATRTGCWSWRPFTRREAAPRTRPAAARRSAALRCPAHTTRRCARGWAAARCFRCVLGGGDVSRP